MSLCAIVGPDGRRWELVPGGAALIAGRGVEADIRLACEKVSRRHASFVWAAGAEVPHVEDLASANGLYVDGIRVRVRHPLGLGARVGLGEVTLQVLYEDSGLLKPLHLPPMSFRGEPIPLGEGRPLGRVLLGLEERGFSGLAYLGEQRFVLLCEGRVKDARCGKLTGLGALRLLRHCNTGACRLSSTVYLPDLPIDVAPSALERQDLSRPGRAG